MFLFFLVVVAAFALYVMSPDERRRLLRTAIRSGLYVKDGAVRVHTTRDPFYDALHSRTPWPVVTPAIVLLNVIVFVRMLFGDGSFADPQTLVAWGGSYGPRTTNGEWWRLGTHMFVHAGFFHLIAEIAGLAFLGLLLERLIGPCAFAAVFIASGIFAGLASLSADPMSVTVGMSGAICGVLGLLIAVSVWSFFPRSPFSIRVVALQPIAPGSALFLLYSLATGRLDGVALNGLVMGLVCGLLLARGFATRKPPALRTAVAFGSTLVIAVAAAIPLRGFTDVKPELQYIVAIEARSASVYDKAVDQFKLGGMNAEALAELIERSILPELQSAHARLTALDRVPSAHQSIIARATEYLRLRRESWRLRVDGLLNRSMPTLQKADRTERASLDALEDVRSFEHR